MTTVIFASLFLLLARNTSPTAAFVVVVGQQRQQRQASSSAQRRRRNVAVCAAGPKRSTATGCSVELVDPETGCDVVLLGCFHGSKSSAVDVENALKQRQASVIALELCATRFADLRRGSSSSCNASSDLLDENDRIKKDVSGEKIMKKKKRGPHHPSWVSRYFDMVLRTTKKQGVSTGVAAAVLGGVSGMQTALSGLQPGLEFTTALRMATKDKVDIVLADQDVDVTLKKMGQLPARSLDAWKEFLATGDWDKTFGQDATALKTALLGADEQEVVGLVTLPAFLTRNEAAIRDVVRLTIPPLLVLQAINLSIGELLTRALNPDVAVAAATAASDMADPSSLTLLVLNLLFVVGGYVSVALPATRVILRERDDQLTEGIRAACRLATENGNRRGGRVVAVLGLLHVNGVAQRMLASAEDEETTD